MPINILSPTGTNNANFYDFYHTGNGSNTDTTNYLTPVGSFADSPSPYGAYDMGGDVYQWTDGIYASSSRGLRGGAFDNYSYILASYSGAFADPTYAYRDTGFRIVISVAVPEPGSIALLLAGAVGSLAVAWRRTRRS